MTRFDGAPIGTGRPGPWTLRAREAREAFIRGGPAPAMTRDELVRDTRQLIDEGERLVANPSHAALQVWLQLTDDLLAARLGLDGPLPPRVALGRAAERGDPRPRR